MSRFQPATLPETAFLPSAEEFRLSLISACEKMCKEQHIDGLRELARRLQIKRDELRDIYTLPESVITLQRWKLVLILKELKTPKDEKGELFIKLEDFRPHQSGNAFKCRKTGEKRQIRSYLQAQQF